MAATCDEAQLQDVIDALQRFWQNSIRMQTQAVVIESEILASMVAQEQPFIPRNIIRALDSISMAKVGAESSMEHIKATIEHVANESRTRDH